MTKPIIECPTCGCDLAAEGGPNCTEPLPTVSASLHSDPDVEVGGYFWLERTDGREIWRQHLRVKSVENGHYILEPVDYT